MSSVTRVIELPRATVFELTVRELFVRAILPVEEV